MVKVNLHKLITLARTKTRDTIKRSRGLNSRIYPSLGTLRGMFVAQSIKPQARTLAESRGITCVEVDYDALRGKQSDEWTLFN
jgi:hypothetical protein